MQARVALAECFEMECTAMKRVRDDMGLTNVELMVPFVRTLTEASKVIALLGRNGLERGATSTSGQASAMGVPLWQSLGFEIVTRYRRYLAVDHLHRDDHPQTSWWDDAAPTADLLS